MSNLQELKGIMKAALENKFGEINEYGAYCDNGEWLSTESVYELICETLDNNDWLIIDD